MTGIGIDTLVFFPFLCKTAVYGSGLKSNSGIEILPSIRTAAGPGHLCSPARNNYRTGTVNSDNGVATCDFLLFICYANARHTARHKIHILAGL